MARSVCVETVKVSHAQRREAPFRLSWLLRAALGCLAFGFAGSVRAEESLPARRTGHVSAYWANWVDSRLPTFPVNAVTGNLTFRDASMVGLVASRVIVDDIGIPLPWSGAVWRGHSIEVEGQLMQHFGLQRHTEISAALVFRTADIGVIDRLSVNFAWGNGLSYALSDPDFEFGTGGLRGIATKRLQYHMIFESEWRHADWRRVSLFTRLHHRSGIYGIISPQRTGSNYIGAGLRLSLY